MKCEECIKDGKRSKIYSQGCSRTLMGTTSYYDEDGIYHYHDPNVTTEAFRCSNGHEFLVKRTDDCDICRWRGK